MHHTMEVSEGRRGKDPLMLDPETDYMSSFIPLAVTAGLRDAEWTLRGRDRCPCHSGTHSEFSSPSHRSVTSVLRVS